MKLSHYKLSVVYLTHLHLQNIVISEKWSSAKKDFFRVHIISKYEPCPLISSFDFDFLSYAEAARYASMFSCLDHTRIHFSYIHFNK